MLLHTLHANLRYGVVQSAALAVLISLAVALVTTGTALGVCAGFAVNSLWREVTLPDAVHTYAGAPDVKDITKWAGKRSDIRDYHLTRSLPVPVRQLTIVGKS